MKTVTVEEFRLNKERFLIDIERGSVFIHPTDTIYGIGCDATNTKAVQRIRSIKNRHNRPFSVIAPSKEWIMSNCEVTPEAQEWLEKLPGPYTLILKIKNREAIAQETILDKDTLGVRIPDHWFSRVAKELNKPIITTSANKAGQYYMRDLEDLDHAVGQHIDFIVYEGPKNGKPSKLIDLTMEEIFIEERI